MIEAAAHPVAEPWIHRVGRRAGIDEQRSMTDAQRQRQRIGVRVAAIQVAVSAGVEDGMSPSRSAR